MQKLKKEFINKNIPKAPPKHAFSGISYSPVLLEERRNALEEWMGKLLSDIDVSRSAPVAGFLELEAAARSSFLCLQDHSPETNSAAKVIATSSSTKVLHSEKKNWAYGSLAKNELLNKCRDLHRRLQECSINVLKEEHKSKITQPFSADIDFLATSDNQIEAILAEAQILARDDEEANSDMDATKASGISGKDDDISSIDKEIRKVLVDMLLDNAKLRKQINYLARYNLNTTTELEEESH